MPKTLFQNNLTELLISNQPLVDTLTILYNNHITYGLYAGCFVALNTSNRRLVDIDILLADKDMQKARSLFPQGIYTKKDYGQLLITDSSETIELMSHMKVSLQGHSYLFRLTQETANHTHTEEINKIHITLLNPVDTILLKAMLQRGISEGKHDIEDIKALLKHTTVNKAYLKIRLQESHADIRVTELLHSLDIL